MKIFVVVNRVEEIAQGQTTALLIAALVRHGCDVHLAEVDAFSFRGSLDRNSYFVNAVKVILNTACNSSDVEAFAKSRHRPKSARDQSGRPDSDSDKSGQRSSAHGRPRYVSVLLPFGPGGRNSGGQ